MSLESIFVARWPFWVGGIAIGLFVVTFLFATGKTLGVSTGLTDACSAVVNPEVRTSWRLKFLGGIALGGLLSTTIRARVLATPLEWTTNMGLFDQTFGSSMPTKAAVFLAGGLMIGFGTRLAGGCTSGHGIVGTALFARSSWIATATFMLVGGIVTNLVYRGLF